MDLKSEFRDLDLNDDKEPVLPGATPLNEENLPEKMEDFSEGDKIIKDLQRRLDEIKQQEESPLEDEDEEDDEEDMGEPTFLERFQPFILPICLTIFALIFAALFLYFFSKSKIQQSISAITNTGAVEQVYIPPTQPQVIVVEEPLTCTEPQVLNETGDECIDLVIVEPNPPAVVFEDGTTTIAHVRFSFDKFNYDMYPRGIYMLEEQIFEGEYVDYKIAPTNRAFANDYFFGVDRYTVSLIGDCQYVIDDANILIRDMRLGNNKFTGNVVKVLNSSKPHIVCEQ